MVTAAEVKAFLDQTFAGRLVFDQEAYDQLPEEVRTALLVQNKDQKTYRLCISEDVTGLKSALQKSREETDAMRRAKAELEQRFDGLDPAVAREALDKIAALADKSVLDKDGLEALKAKHTADMREHYERMVKAKEDENLAKTTEAAEWKSKWKNDRVRERLLAAAAEKKANPDTMEDIVARGVRIFALDDDGKLHAKRPEDGEIWVGRDGFSELTPTEFMDHLREKVPSFWPPSDGGGAGGSKKRGGKDDYANLPPVDRLTRIRQERAANKGGGA